MNDRGAVVVRLLGGVMLAVVLILAGVLAFCWLVGWRTTPAYGYALIGAGVIAIAFAVFGVMGNTSIADEPRVYFARLGDSNLKLAPAHRNRQAAMDSADLGVVVGVAGMLVVLIGSLIVAQVI